MAKARARARKARKKKVAGPKAATPDVTARDVMNPVVLTVREDMTVRELATFLTENEISGAPVQDARGKLVGVVSLRDIVESATESEEELSEKPRPLSKMGWGNRLTPNELSQMHIENEGLLVRDIMTPSVYTIDAGARVSKVAQAMISGHVHRLVVTQKDKPVGIVSTMDLLKLLV
jgi:CBS domain-containing protein